MAEDRQGHGGTGRAGFTSLLAMGPLLMLAVGCQRERPLPPGLGEGVKNHEFRVIASPASALPAGAELDLRSFRGRPVVLDFWASWCGPCRRVHDGMVQMAERYGERVAFLGVSYQDDPDDAALWLREHGSNFPAVEDIEGRFAHTFWVNAIPRIVLLGPDGRLANDLLPSFGFPEDVRAQLDSLLAASGSEAPSAP